MFGLFNKKQEDKTEIEKGSTDIYFNVDTLPKEHQQEKIYLYEWCQNDGDWVEKGQAIYRIQVGPSFGTVLASAPFIAKTNGVLQQLKKKTELIVNGEKVYTIHQKGKYENEGKLIKDNFYFYFNKYKYQIPEKYLHHKIKINQWHKEDGEFIKRGELLLTLGYETSYGNNETHQHYAEMGGYIDKVRTQLDFMGMEQNELIYIIHEQDDNRVKRKFVNTPDIKIDDFTGKKILKWKQVGNNGGYSEGLTSKSLDSKISFTFTLNNIDEKDFIVFQFYSKELMLSKDDSVSFLFADNKIIDFKININSYKSSHPYIEKLFENKVQITSDELECFEKQQFLKWKITLKKQNREIIGGNEGCNQYKSFNNLTTVIKKITKEYRALVEKEIPNYKPLQRDTLANLKESIESEECYVYLMIDINNHYHKIGISNKPEWREKTLQSEKPTIELLASKKFVTRKIASSIEKALHHTYSDKRIRGEWFQLDTKDIEEIKTTLSS